jgi:sulfotransferase family protein
MSAFGALRRWLTRGSRGEPIIVVSGLPRSGTSMMMNMLAAGGLEILADGERVADIDNPKGYFELERIKNLEKETDKSYLRAARGKAVKVISFLIKDLPGENDYRVLFMRRDLDEVLASQQKMIDRLESADSDAEAAAMKEAFRNDIARVRMLCRTRPNFALREIRYKDAVADPAAASRAVNEFLGGRLDEAAMRAAVDAALYRNRARNGG